MSTHAAIIEKTATGYRGIYCNADGYLGYVGKILQENYTDPVKVSSLIDLGDISVLGVRVNPLAAGHSWDKREKGTTVASFRDRGEDFNPQAEGETLEEVLEQFEENYVYVFENGKWTCNSESYYEKNGKWFFESGRKDG